MAGSEDSATRYALLIGINAYSAKPLKGCVRDVQEMNNYLLKTFDPVHIEMLTASEDPNLNGSGPVEDKMIWPTYDNLLQRVTKITMMAKAGDYVYIHYSGHGSRINPGNENKYLGDVALILIHGQSEGQIYAIPGSFLAAWANKMVEKGLLVTIVLDCCFSGGVARDDDLESIRFLDCTDGIDLIYPYSAQEVVPPIAAGTLSRDGSMMPNWLINPDGYTILTACGPHEVAREPLFEDQKRHGALSYFLLRTLQKVGNEMKSQQDIYTNVSTIFREKFPKQNPVLYGNKSLRFFGPALSSASDPHIPVIKNGNSLLKLQVGRAHGVCESDLFELVPFHSEANIPGIAAKEPIMACVTKLGSFSSDLDLLDQSTLSEQIRGGWVAKPITRLRLLRYAINVPSTLPDRDKWLEASKQHKSLSVNITESIDEPSSFKINADENDFYIIQDELNNKIPYIPAILKSDEGHVNKILDTIQHLAWFKYVASIENPQPADWLRNSYRIHLTDSSKQRFGPEKEIKVLHNNIVTLELENSGDRALYFHIYILTQEWQIENLYRGSHIAMPPRNPKVSPAISKKLRVQMTIPTVLQQQGCTESEDIIKVFVTSQPTTFTSLEIHKLDSCPRMNSDWASTRVDESEGTQNDDSMDWLAVNLRLRINLNQS